MSNSVIYPSNPSIGDEFEVGRVTKVWDGEKLVNKYKTINAFRTMLIAQGYSGNYGFFEDGFEYKEVGDVGITADNTIWIYVGTGAPDKVVAAGTVPSVGMGYEQVAFNSASDVLTKTNETAQDFIDSFALKIFQSPTEGGLTEIQTRTVDAGEVYEVRKTSDGSLATIYSDAAGTTEMVQNGTINVSDSGGVVEFYIGDGDYYVEIGGVKGGLLVSRLKPFDNVAAMVSSVGLAEGQTVKTNGYHAKGDGGACTYIVKTSAKASSDGDYVDGFGSVTSPSGLVFVMHSKYRTPLMFGAKEGFESGDELQAFFESAQRTLADYHAIGSYDINKRITIRSALSGTLRLDLRLKVTAELGDHAIALNRTGLITTYPGKLVLYSGNRPVAYEDRLFDYGLKAFGTARCHYEFLQVEGARIEGLNLDSDHGGNCNLTTFGTVRAFECGYYGEVNYSNISNNGSLGSFSQHAEIDIDFVPNTFLRGVKQYVGYIKIGDILHGIETITGNKARIFPRVRTSVETTGTATLYIGGGIGDYGGDGGVIGFDNIDTSGCASSVRFAPLYMPEVGRLTSQFDGLGIVLGSRASGATQGGNISSYYTEGNDYDIISSSTAMLGFEITSAVPSTREKWVATPAAFLDGDDVYAESFRNLAIGHNGDMMRTNISSKDKNVLKNGKTLNILGNTEDVSLLFNERDFTLYGKNVATIYLTGTGVGGAFTSLNITDEGGRLVNGASSLSIPAGAPVQVNATYRRTNDRWYISWVRFDNS